MSDEQIPFNFEKRQQKKPSKPKELPKPEPPRPSLLRRCWSVLCRLVLVPLGGFALSCVPQTFRSVVSAVLVPMIVAALGIHYYQAPPSLPPPKIELLKPELPKGEPPNAEPIPAERNPWEPTVKPE